MRVLYVFRPEGQRELGDREFDLPVNDAGGGEHFLRRSVHRRAVVFVGEINDLFDAGLDDRLRALVAGEQRHVDTAAVKVRAAIVEDRVQLRVADVGVFRVGVVPGDGNARPGKHVVAASAREAVVAHGHDFVFLADDAGADLRVRVLAALRGEQRDAHEVFVPG